MWFNIEKKYDATKEKCHNILKALKKFKYWLYGVRFVWKIDANVLVAQLNWSDTDLPKALVFDL